MNEKEHIERAQHYCFNGEEIAPLVLQPQLGRLWEHRKEEVAATVAVVAATGQ